MHPLPFLSISFLALYGFEAILFALFFIFFQKNFFLFFGIKKAEKLIFPADKTVKPARHKNHRPGIPKPVSAPVYLSHKLRQLPDIFQFIVRSIRPAEAVCRMYKP